MDLKPKAIFNLSQTLAVAAIRWRHGLFGVGIGLLLLTMLPHDHPWVVRWIGEKAAGWLPGGRLDFDRSIENMFAPDDPLLVPYQQLKRRFGGNELVLAVYQDPDLFREDGSGIRRLGEIAQRLAGVAGVEDVLSLSEVNAALQQTNPLNRLLKRNNDGRAIVDPQSKLAGAFRDLFEGYTHGTATDSAAIVCMLYPEAQTTVSRKQTIDSLRRIINTLPGGLQGTLAGEPVMVVDGFRYVERDGRWLGYSTTLLLGLAIVVCFRSIRWVVIPLAVVRLSLRLTEAIVVWSGIRLSMVSSMLTALITVIGVATVVHIIIRFRLARSAGDDPRLALQHALTQLAFPITWACLTDAVGFLSLLVAQVGPVKDFGIMMAIGSLTVPLSVLLLVPMLALWGEFDRDPHRAWGEQQLSRALRFMIEFVHRHPRWVGWGTFAFVVITVLGITRLTVETDFTRNFRRQSPIVQSYQLIEDRLGGAGVWDIVLPAPPVLTEAYLDKVRTLESRLRALEIPAIADRDAPQRLTKVISLADAVDATNVLPVLRLIPAEQRVEQMERLMPTFSAAMRTSQPDEQGHCYLRIMLRAKERQSAEQKLALIAAVERTVEATFPAEREATAEPQVTGFFVLLANLIKSVIRDQWTCFGVATVAIFLMMWLAFGRVHLAAAAIVPNALPILVVLGVMGWLGLRINMGAAMIAAVSMGLSIDSSIHYLTAYQRARRAGLERDAALLDVQQTVGRALFFSTMSLMVGFLVLCSSEFIPTIYFGALVCLSMLGGLLGNLIVLPLLLYADQGRYARTDSQTACSG